MRVIDPKLINQYTGMYMRVRGLTLNYQPINALTLDDKIIYQAVSVHNYNLCALIYHNLLLCKFYKESQSS